LKLLLDLHHNFGQRISLRRFQISLFVFAKDLKQVNWPVGVEILIDHTHSTALTSAAPGKSNLSDTSGACQNIAPQGMSRQEIDKLIPLVLLQELFGTRSVGTRLDDRLHL
jgi:hypothetical protein